MKACFKCGKEFESDYKPGFRDECPACYAFVHACLNCRFYDKFAHNHCREPASDYVQDAENGNFCEQFVFGSGKKTDDRSGRAKNKFDDLFGK